MTECEHCGYSGDDFESVDVWEDDKYEDAPRVDLHALENQGVVRCPSCGEDSICW